MNNHLLYNSFIDYYGDISFKKIKTQDNWVIYACKVFSGLNINRYIFVIVENNKFNQEQTTLSKLRWICFQTRNTDETYDVPTHHLYINETKKNLLSQKINVIDRDKQQTNYICPNLPIKIRLLLDPKKNNFLQYPDNALLFQALETYNCIIDIL